MAVDEADNMALQPLETPVLKVSRPVAACSRCRNAKIKCDGKLPACSSCEKNGRAAECTSTNDQFARGKERSYVSTLETRIDKLQAKLDEARARKPSVIDVPEEESATAAPSRRPSRPVIPGEPPTPTTTKLLKRNEVTAIDDLVSDFGFLSVNATARDFYGFTTAMSYARLILSACSKDELPKGTTKALPARHVATTLIQHYLDNVFVLLPVFDEATFYTSVDNVYNTGLRQAEPLDHWMVRVVLAIASASMSQQRGDKHYMEGIGHICAAIEYAEVVLRPGNLTGVQALIMLTQYALLDPHHFDSWSLIGAASRAMSDLGLHQDPPKGTPMPRPKLELRRRVFHCIYTLDRSTSLVQTRAFSFSDDSAKVKIPFHRQPTSQPGSPAASDAPNNQWLHSYESALDLINFRKIQSAWYSELFQSGRTQWDDPYPFLWDTCDAMRKWFENISPNTSKSLRAFFELDLLYSRVYVLSPSPRVPTILPFAQKLIFEYCIQYAELMISLISDPGYTAPLTFYDAMRVYMTGRQFLDVLSTNADMLLSGSNPPHPEVKPTTAPPPPMPVPQLPPGETLQRFNIMRSMNCIKQITDCLARFGIRWGFMSWNQRYQNETGALLDSLQQRLREYDENNARRPSMWGSVTSIPSSNGSFSFYSPEQTLSRASTGYGSQQQQSSPPVVQPTGSYIDRQHISPPQFHQQPAVPQYQAQAGAQFAQHPQYQQGPPQQQYTFTEPAYQHPAPSNQPNQQFATWGGYGGPSVPDTLDEENADPSAVSIPEPAQLPALMSPAANTMLPPSLHLLLNRGGPARQFSLAISPTDVRYDQRASLGLAPVDSNPTYIYSPRTSVVSGIVGALAATPGNLRPSFNGRTSMQEAALDLLQSTYPPGHATMGVPAKPGNARGRVSKKYKGKGKGRATDVAPPPPPARSTSGPGDFWFAPGVGYVCIVCNKICHQPDQHRTSLDGGGCVDIGMAAVPMFAEATGSHLLQHQQHPPPVELDAGFSVVSQGRVSNLMRENVNPVPGKEGARQFVEEMPFGFTSVYQPQGQLTDPAVSGQEAPKEKERRRSVVWRD